MPNLLSRIISSIKGLLLRQVTYLDQQAYQLNTNNKVLLPTTHSSKVLIVSRHNYIEQIQWLPVARLSEAKKLVKFAQRSRGAGHFYILAQPLNGKTPVIWYQFKPQVLACKAMLYLPETALLAMQCQQGEVLTYQSPDQINDIYLSCTHAGAVSAVKGGLLQSDQQFMLAQGAGLQRSISLSAAQHKQHLIAALFKLQQVPLAGLVNKAAFQRNSSIQSFSRYIWPLAGAVTLYLMATSYWAQFQLQQSQQQVLQANRAANQLLIQRDDINTMLGRYWQLQQVLPESNNLLHLWQVLAALYQQGVTISSIQQRQQQISLRIEADSATQALQLLVQQAGVTQAKLDGNVRRQGDKDVATVNFILQQEPL